MTDKKAVEILKPLFEQCKGTDGCLGYIEHYFSKAEEEALDLAIKALEESERSQDVWIPVCERSPEEKWFNPSGSDFGFDFEEVLCTTIWGNVRAYKFGKPIGHDKPHFWLGGRIMDEYVTAWQPLPEPYKEGGAE